jgi:kynurenine formamidase
MKRLAIVTALGLCAFATQAAAQSWRPPLPSGCPGIGLAAAEWLIKQDPMLLGADNWPVEIAPNPDKAINLPVHNLALTVNGVHLLENLVLEELAKARVYEFAFVMQPLKLQGATGSTVAPTAIR